jgi:phenylacetate-CoA ligase
VNEIKEAVNLVDVYQEFTKNFLTLLDSVQGRSTFKCLKSLKKFQQLDSEKIRKIQLERLRHLLRFSYEHVPYYHKVFRENNLKPHDIQDLADLEKLPILTKDIIRKNFQELIATNYSAKGTVLCSTSGTTGEPICFLKTKQQQSWENAAGYLATSWYGFDPGYKHALLWALPSSLSVWQKKLNFLVREKVLNTFKMSQETLRQFAREMTTFKPDVLRGYSTMLHFFAHFAKEEGIEIRPRSVVATGEDLVDYQRREIQDVFGCDSFSFYASREISAIAAECFTHEGYHVMDSNVVLEIIKDGLQIHTEETGMIVLTGLTNYGMPLIRYQIGDLARLSTEKCSCGKSLSLIKKIDGRISDILIDVNSYYSASPSAHYVFKGLPVKQYQIVQETAEKIKIKIVRGEGYSEKDAEVITQRVQQYLGTFNVTFEYVYCISPQRSGKMRVIKSQLPRKRLSNVFSYPCNTN